MLTYQQLIEKKLSQLNQQHVGTVKGLETAMHSQGIEPGKAKRDGHHVQYPKATFRKSGKSATGITAVDDGKGKLTSSTGGKQIRDAVLASGRVNKTPAAKAKRAKEAAENKERKAKNRDPFTREHSEWWLGAFRLVEYDASQLQGANSKQADIAQRRQADRIAKGGKGSEGSSTPSKVSTRGSKERSRRIKQGNNVGFQGNKSIEKRPTTTGTRPNAGGSIVKSNSQLAKRPVDTKGSSMVRTTDTAPKGKNREGSQVGKRAPATKGYMTSPDGIRKPNNPNKSKNPIHGTTASKNSQKPGGPQESDYAKARKDRDITNKLDKEDKNKGRTWKDLKAVGKYAGRKSLDLAKKATSGTVGDGVGSSGPDSVQGSSEIIRGKRG